MENVKKIDVYIHILPEEKRLESIKYQGEECTWVKADIETYINLIDEYNIDKAILQPTNDMYMYYPARKTNELHAEIIR